MVFMANRLKHKGAVMKYEILVIENGVEKSIMTVKSEARAVELVAIYNDIDCGTGRTYSYRKIGD